MTGGIRGIRQPITPGIIGRTGSGRGAPQVITLADLAKQLKLKINGGLGSKTPSIQTLLDTISSTQGVVLYRGASEWDALAPGTDGQVLTTHDTGNDPTWEDVAAPSGSPGFHPGFTASRYYTAPTQSEGSLSTSTGTLYAIPFYVADDTTFSKISCDVFSSPAASGKRANLMIYANSSGVPGALEYNCGTVTVDALGVREITGLSLILSAGWHWLAVSVEATVTLRTKASDNFFSYLLGKSATNVSPSGYFVAWTFSAGSPPNPFGSPSQNTGQQPLVYLRL